MSRRTAIFISILTAMPADPRSPPNAAKAEDQTVLVELRNHQFEPRLVRVRPGQTIEFNNADDALHSLALLGREDVLGEEFIDPGKAYTLLIPENMPHGTYELACTIHVDMRVQLLVRED